MRVRMGRGRRVNGNGERALSKPSRVDGARSVGMPSSPASRTACETAAGTSSGVHREMALASLGASSAYSASVPSVSVSQVRRCLCAVGDAYSVSLPVLRVFPDEGGVSRWLDRRTLVVRGVTGILSVDGGVN